MGYIDETNTTSGAALPRYRAVVWGAARRVGGAGRHRAMQKEIHEMRRAAHDRLGKVHLEAAMRALPTNCDTKFCRDAVTTVDLLIHCKATLSMGFVKTLRSDEKRDVDFVRQTRALQSARDSNRVLEKANALWFGESAFQYSSSSVRWRWLHVRARRSNKGSPSVDFVGAPDDVGGVHRLDGHLFALPHEQRIVQR